MGVDTIEMDVVISKDKLVVVSHEPWMNENICLDPKGNNIQNNSKEKYNLFQMNYEEIKCFDCGKKINGHFPLQKKMPEYKPLLSDVILRVEEFTKENNLKSIIYNVEIKSDAAEENVFQPPPENFVELVYGQIKKYDVAGRTILQSFDSRILKEIRKKDRAITIALLVENNLGFEENINALGFNPDIYAPEYILVNETLVKKAHSLGIKIISWTVNELSDIKKLIEIGVDGIISDYPDRVIALKGNTED